MYAWEAIQKTVDELEHHLQEDYSIEQLAQCANLSLFYYQRLFTRLVGKSVNEYKKARRLAHAKEDIKKTKEKLIDIATKYGFDSHETFTKSFKDLYGITPSEYRKTDVTLTDFLKPDLSMFYTLVDENIPLIVDDMIVEIRKEEVLDVQNYTGISLIEQASEMNKIGVNKLVPLWDQFHNVKNEIKNLKQDGVEVDYFTYGLEAGTIQYFVGADSDSNHMEPYHLLQLKQGTYYVCRFEAESFAYLVNDALYKANRYFFEVWLKQKGIGMEQMEPFLLQKYLNVTDDPKIEIWIKVL